MENEFLRVFPIGKLKGYPFPSLLTEYFSGLYGLKSSADPSLITTKFTLFPDLKYRLYFLIFTSNR